MEHLNLALKFIAEIWLRTLYLLLQLALVFLVPYSLLWAFGPYEPLETNAAGLCAFLALSGYWYWKFTNRDSDIKFWKLF